MAYNTKLHKANGLIEKRSCLVTRENCKCFTYGNDFLCPNLGPLGILSIFLLATFHCLSEEFLVGFESILGNLEIMFGSSKFKQEVTQLRFFFLLVLCGGSDFCKFGRLKILKCDLCLQLFLLSSTKVLRYVVTHGLENTKDAAAPRVVRLCASCHTFQIIWVCFLSNFFRGLYPRKASFTVLQTLPSLLESCRVLAREEN
mmetsp:Transcript_59245/g.93999  ORF Transcript_59245/g.93999 Transcript_59245/m.93999 type:complete len:201 (+) Transcript_59245:999-1601(+)